MSVYELCFNMKCSDLPTSSSTLDSDVLGSESENLAEIELLNDLLANLPADSLELKLKYSRSILKLSPESTIAWWNLLNSLAQLQRADELKTYAEIAHDTFKSEPSFLYFLGWSYFISGEEYYLDALTIFKRVVDMDSEYDPALYWIGELYYLNGDIEQSVEWLSKAAQQSPNRGGYRSRLALVLLFSGKVENALRFAEEALALEPWCQGTRNNVFELYLNAGLLENAEVLALQAQNEETDQLELCWREKHIRSTSVHAGEVYVPLYLRTMPGFSYFDEAPHQEF
jgi:tetratricopeptide (TPR) repeat protein